MPTVHGFDEFFGNLYHLNAERSRRRRTGRRRKDFPRFDDLFRPARRLHSWATEEDDDTEEGRFGRVGRQRIEDTGPLTKKRMQTMMKRCWARARFRRSPGRGRHAVLLLVQHDAMHSHHRSRREGIGRRAMAVAHTTR